MRDTTMTLQRNKAVIRASLPCQIANMSWKEAMDLGAGSPYDAHWIRTTGGGLTDIRRGDLLIDEHEIDPVTNAATKYRVFSRPRQLYEAYMEIQAEQIVGT
jgi:hypothetical protein